MFIVEHSKNVSFSVNKETSEFYSVDPFVSMLPVLLLAGIENTMKQLSKRRF